MPGRYTLCAHCILLIYRILILLLVSVLYRSRYRTAHVLFIHLKVTLLFWAVLWIRGPHGSALIHIDPVDKNDPQKKKKGKKYIVWGAGFSLWMAVSFFTLDVLHEGLGINILQFLIILQLLNPWIRFDLKCFPDPHWNQCGSTALGLTLKKGSFDDRNHPIFNTIIIKPLVCC